MRLNANGTGVSITSQTEYRQMITVRDIISRMVALDAIDSEVLVTIDAMMNDWATRYEGYN